MFDIGGSELLVIAVVALVVLGPKELPAAVRNIQGLVRKARELARDFQSGLSDMAREIDLDKMKAEVKQAIDPGELETIGQTIHKEFASATDELKKTFDPDSLTAPSPAGPEPAAEPETAAGLPEAPPPAPETGPPPPEIAPPPAEILATPSPKPGA